MPQLKSKFEIANDYEDCPTLMRFGATYAYVHNQDEEDFFVADPATGDFMIDPATGNRMQPELDVEYPLLRAGFNQYYAPKYYANVMLTKGVDDFLGSECNVGRDSYDVSILLRMKDEAEVLTSLAGRRMVGKSMERAPLAEGHSADVITPLFK